VVSQKEYAYDELNIFRQTMPSSGVTWHISSFSSANFLNKDGSAYSELAGGL
jgi:hypothetical protein